MKRNYVLVCPVCNSKEVYPVTDVIGKAFQTYYHCNNCGYTSPFFLRVRLEEAEKLKVKKVDLEAIKHEIVPVLSTNYKVLGWRFKSKREKVDSAAFNLVKLELILLLPILFLVLLVMLTKMR